MKRVVTLLTASALCLCTFAILSQEQQQPVQATPQPAPKSPMKMNAPPASRVDSKKTGGIPVKANPAEPAAAEEETGPPPKMEVPEMEFNAGEVIKGDVIEHDFVVNNKGEGVLKITRVQPTCGCTVTKYDNEILPGKSGKITASVKTEGFTGDVAKTINVQTNDKELGTFALTVKAKIKTLLSVKPSEKLTLGLVYVGQPLEKEFDIVAEDGQAFDVTQITTADDKVSYNLIPAADKKSAKFKVTVPQDYPVGPIQANFTLKTTHAKVPTLNINVFGTMREPLSVFPNSVQFNGLGKDFITGTPDSPELNKVITVRLETEATLEVKSVKSSLPFVEVTSENTQPNQAYSVKVHLVPEKVKVGPFEGVVTIFTNKKTITVPVKGVIF